MTRSTRHTIQVIGLAFLCALMVTSMAQAQEPVQGATKITIEPLRPVEAGKPVVIDAQLTLVSGEPSGALNNEGIELFIDGVRERRVLTDPDGKVSFRLQRELPPGTHFIKVAYGGSRALLPSEALTTLTVNPPAADQAGQPVPSTMTIEPLQAVAAGKPVVIDARLGLESGEPSGALNNEAVELAIDGTLRRRARTDSDGKVSFRLPGEFPPGTYNIQVAYRGSRALSPSEASTALTINPAVTNKAGGPAPTTITIERLQPVEIGRPVTIDARLGLESGEPSGALDNEVIQLYIDGMLERRARTDPDGKVSFRLQRELPPGSYEIHIEYPGSRALVASLATTMLEMVPAQVTIQTVPPLPGMEFALGEQIFASDDQGVARITVTRSGVYPLKVHDVESYDSNVQLKFARWMDDAFTASRAISIPLSKPLVVGFNVSYRVGQTFVDLAGKPFDPDRISSLTLRNTQGTVLKLDDAAPRWLLASSVARRTNGLEATQIQYGVDSVMVDGSNVVNQAQQRFYAAPNDTWAIQLQLYSMSVSGRDALFGFPIGSGLRLEYPDGRVEVKPFTPGARVSVDSLVRGIYRVSVSGAPGLAPISPVALSRDQDVSLLVISYLDLAVALGLAAILGIGLVVVGRPRLLPALIHQLGAVRSISLAQWRHSILHLPDRLRLALASESASESESPTPSRRKLDYTLMLAVAFISIGGLAGGLGALRASAIQASSTPPPNSPASIISSPARPTPGVPEQVVPITPSEMPSSPASTIPAPVFTNPPTPDVSTPVSRTQPRQAATPGKAPSAPASSNPTQVFTNPPAPGDAPSAPAGTHSTEVLMLPLIVQAPPRQPATPSNTPSAPTSSNPTKVSTLEFQRILREGSRGPDVVSLQQRLRELGYFTYKTNTGYFGSITQSAVTAFQVDHCMPETGVVDAEVVKALTRNGSACAAANRNPAGSGR